MKRLIKAAIFISVFILMLLLLPTLKVSALQSDTSSQTQQEIIGEQKNLSGADKLPSKAPESAKNGLNSLGIKEADQKSLSAFTPANLLKSALNYLKEVSTAPFKACVSILAVLLACALLNTLKSTFSEKSLQNVFDIVAALCLAAIILVPITKLVNYCASIINDSSKFMISFLPVFSSLAAVSGRPASGIISQSLLMIVSQVLSSLTSTIFVPMVDIYLAFCVVGSIAPNINITGIAGFMKRAVTWVLTLSLTVYTGILTVQGVIASAADNVSVKAAKFVVDGAIPVIGSTISDAMNTVISCTGLLKTTVGAYAIVVFILTYLPPVLECLLWLFTIELALAVADILGINNMTGLLTAVKEAVRLIIALVIASGLAMIISVSVMLLLGKGS